MLDCISELFVEKVCFLLVTGGYFSIKYDRYIGFVFGLFLVEEVEGCPQFVGIVFIVPVIF